MKQRFGAVEGIEIVSLVPEKEICRKAGAGSGFDCELLHRAVREEKEVNHQEGDNDEQKSGADPSQASGIEAEITETSLGCLPKDDAGDEKTGDHEEYVDADKAAGKEPWPCV